MLLLLLGIMISATVTGAFIRYFLPEGGMVAVWDLLGTRIQLSPVSAAIVVIASLAAETFTILNIRKPSKKLEAVIIVLFTGVTATLALVFGRYFLSMLMVEAFSTLMLLLTIAVFAGVYVLFLVLIDVPTERAKNLLLQSSP